jgi:NAD(P)-dependent dehydrogenase (short-subunit alcohol dehydrogenase family)
MSRVVVITGAASGIGRATALRFAQTGARVHVCDLAGDGAEAVAAEVRAAGGQGTAHAVDVADPDAVEALAESVYAGEDRVDVLHNNAGIGVSGPLESITLEDWQRVIAVDLMGVVYGMRSFAPRMVAQGGRSTIVNTASMAGLVSSPYLAGYSAAKHGVVGLTKALNVELAPQGVHVCAVCPGVINTPIARSPQRGGFADPERVAAMFERFGADPDVVAQTVVRLADRPRVIATVPRWHVDPPWLIERVAPGAYQKLMQLVSRRTISRLSRP